MSQQPLRNSAPVCHQCNDKAFRRNQKCFICTVCEDATHALCVGVMNIYPLPSLRIGLIRPSVPFQYCRFCGQDILDLSVSSCGSGDVSYLLALQRNNMNLHSLSIRRFWGKGERWKRKRERAEGEKLPFSSPPPPSPI